MSRCVSDYIGSKIEVFCTGEILDLDGFENVPPCQDSMCSTRGDVKSGDWNACLMLCFSF